MAGEPSVPPFTFAVSEVQAPASRRAAQNLAWRKRLQAPEGLADG